MKNKKLKKLRIGVVDLETTGLDPKKDRITEFGIVYFEGGKPVSQYNTLINPEMKISAGAMKVSHITNEMVEKEKPFKNKKKKIRGMLEDCDVWCAFNEAFDRSFLLESFARVGTPIDSKMTLDPRIVSDYMWPTSRNNLDAVVQRLRVGANEPMLKKLGMNEANQRHRATYDALLTGLALFRLDFMPDRVKQFLFVQEWMYRYWLVNYKGNAAKFARKLHPTLPS